MKRIDTYRDSVWCDPTLTAHEKLVLLAFSKTMDHDSLGGAHPGDVLVSYWTGLSVRTVKRLRLKLTARRWLMLTHRGGSPKGGKRLASEYRGNIPDRGHGDTGQATRPGTPATRDRGHGDTPPSQGPADDAATTGAATSPAQRTSRSNGRHRDGCTCFDCYHGRPAATA